MRLGEFDRSGRRRPGGRRRRLRHPGRPRAGGHRPDARPAKDLQQRARWSRATRRSSRSTPSPARPRRSGFSPAATRSPARPRWSRRWRPASGPPWASTCYLTGQNHAFWREAHEVDTSFDPDAEPSDAPREKLNLIPVERRRNNFDEVEQPWRETVAVRQAGRCLRCDYGKRCGPCGTTTIRPNRQRMRTQ